MKETIQEYYGRILKTKRDLKTDACCSIDFLPVHLQGIVKEIPAPVVEKFYGCGSPIPALLGGKTVLDLGCGAGRDVFILSRLVGPQGKVLGVDMTEEQLAVAKKYVRFENVQFLQGTMEDLEGLRIASDSVDVVVSNCVLNLSFDKRKVFSEIFRVLKPGGELYFSDVFALRRIPKTLAADPVLLGECLGGAMYIEDFRRLLAELNCLDYRIVTRRRLVLNNPEIEAKAGMIPFHAMTIRLFKLKLEDRCEDYGQVAYYLGTIPEWPHAFVLDDHHLFEKGRRVPVCSNTAAMLAQTRYTPHFRVEGDLSVHFGLLDRRGIKEEEGPVRQGCC